MAELESCNKSWKSKSNSSLYQLKNKKVVQSNKNKDEEADEHCKEKEEEIIEEVYSLKSIFSKKSRWWSINVSYEGC